MGIYSKNEMSQKKHVNLAGVLQEEIVREQLCHCTALTTGLAYLDSNEGSDVQYSSSLILYLCKHNLWASP